MQKNFQTRQKVIDSALLEFGEKIYGEASLNTVCASGNISKGIIYHYFKSKDELYLVCVKACFDALTKHLGKREAVAGASIEEALESYFDARTTFFVENPIFLKLFCNVVVSPPIHLKGEIDEARCEFDALNLSVFSGLISNTKLRGDVTQDEVVEVFREYQDFVNTRFRMEVFNEQALKEHEKRCSRSLKILLYGVIERERN